jgi:hypothetical protein
MPRGEPRALAIETILRWADAYHEARGTWPNLKSGRVAESPTYTWFGIDNLLKRGGCGLPGQSSLRRLLFDHRGIRSRGMEPPLSPAAIAAWAEAHHAATGAWPTNQSKQVAAAPEETWARIDYALASGRRGLPGRSSLNRLLAQHFPAARRVLTLETLLAWGEAHHAVHGRWPTRKSGDVIGAPGENWHNLNQALRYGYRGLPAVTSLAKIFAGRPAPANAPGAEHAPR